MQELRARDPKAIAAVLIIAGASVWIPQTLIAAVRLAPTIMESQLVDGMGEEKGQQTNDQNSSVKTTLRTQTETYGSALNTAVSRYLNSEEAGPAIRNTYRIGWALYGLGTLLFIGDLIGDLSKLIWNANKAETGAK